MIAQFGLGPTYGGGSSPDKEGLLVLAWGPVDCKRLGHMLKVQGMLVQLGLGPVYDEYPPT